MTIVLMPELEALFRDQRNVAKTGQLRRLDFAWPDLKFAVEYDGFDFHADPEALRRDRQKRSALGEVDWRLMSIVSDDIRRRSWEMLRRIDVELNRAEAA